MTQIAEKPRRRPLFLRPALALPAMLALVVAGAVGVVATRQGDATTTAAVTEPAQFADPDAGSPDGLPQLVDRMVLVASTRDNGTPAPGSWVYIKNKITNYYVSGNADTGEETPVSLVSDRQVWTSLDGHRGWLIQTGIDQPEGGETLDSKVAYSGAYDELAKLSTDPGELLARIYAETQGQGNGPDSQAFSRVGDLLGESYPPAALYPALYRAAAMIPGVLVVDDAVDATGRHGIALARVDEGGYRVELMFDKTDYTYLGTRQVLTRDSADGIRAGTVVYSSAIVDRRFVSGMKSVS